MGLQACSRSTTACRVLGLAVRRFRVLGAEGVRGLWFRALGFGSLGVQVLQRMLPKRSYCAHEQPIHGIEVYESPV